MSLTPVAEETLRRALATVVVVPVTPLLADGNPDWAAYAELCGATGIAVARRDELDGAFARLFAADGPALLCVQQDAQLL